MRACHNGFTAGAIAATVDVGGGADESAPVKDALTDSKPPEPRAKKYLRGGHKPHQSGSLHSTNAGVMSPMDITPVSDHPTAVRTLIPVEI